MRMIPFLALLIVSAFAAAQSDGDATRGSTPPGTSQDGSRPAEGAIQGGALQPGEKGGVPDSGAPKTPAAGSAAAGGSTGRLARCYELEGSLREQCLADEASKTGAKARPPSDAAPRRGD